MGRKDAAASKFVFQNNFPGSSVYINYFKDSSKMLSCSLACVTLHIITAHFARLIPPYSCCSSLHLASRAAVKCLQVSSMLEVAKNSIILRVLTSDHRTTDRGKPLTTLIDHNKVTSVSPHSRHKLQPKLKLHITLVLLRCEIFTIHMHKKENFLCFPLVRCCHHICLFFFAPKLTIKQRLSDTLRAKRPQLFNPHQTEMKRNRFKSMPVCRHLLGSRDDRST